MTWSVVFSVQEAVRTVLLAASLPSGVEVMTGPRTVATNDAVAVQDVRATQSRPVTGGIRREQGTFNIRARVMVSGVGEDGIDAARERCDAILEACADALESAVTIGGLVLYCDITEVAEDDQAILDQNKHEYSAHATVSFTADVNPGA